MARRKQSLFEDLIDIAALFPPWLSPILALFSYVILHHYAISEIVLDQSADNPIDRIVFPTLLKTFANIGQYILPIIFFLGAIISFTKRRKRGTLFAQVQARTEVNPLLNMSWIEFEQLVGEAFKRQGYSVNETGSNGPDGGVDLVLTKTNEMFLVQCKQWRAQKVGVNIVRELYGVMAAQGAAGGFIVTSGNFTNEATAFADGRNIELISGNKLMTFISPNNLVKAKATTPSNLSVLISDPSCPVCGNAMVRRVASKGPNAGNAFWGCSLFPKCRGIVNI